MVTPIVTRFAPSPTGLLHLGVTRTGLFNFLYARHHGGRFLLRIEDTDKVRSKKEYEEDILQTLRALHLNWDGEVVYQSARGARHTACLQQLIEEGKAYISREPAKDNVSREVEVVRLRNPGKSITFQDEIRGDITFDTTELGDFVIARSLEDPLFHFAVVVDDADAGVTLVLRGDDHISNTPRQILIQEALGFVRPQYAHIPLILAPDRSKMSKRKGAVATSEYLHDGVSPEALVNYLALLGWNSGTEQELFSLDELVQSFSLEGMQKSGAVFDSEKLKWYNKEYRARRDQRVVEKELLAYLGDFSEIQRVLTRSPKAMVDMLERYATYRECKEAIEQGEFDFYRINPIVSKEMLRWKKDQTPERTQERLQKTAELLSVIEEKNWSYDTVREAVWAYAEAEGRGSVLWPLRMALSGKEHSPDPFVLAEGLGKEKVMARLEHAVKLF